MAWWPAGPEGSQAHGYTAKALGGDLRILGSRLRLATNYLCKLLMLGTGAGTGRSPHHWASHEPLKSGFLDE